MWYKRFTHLLMDPHTPMRASSVICMEVEDHVVKEKW